MTTEKGQTVSVGSTGGLGASAPTATTYTKSYSGRGYFDDNPLAYITLKVNHADAVRVPASLLKQLVQDLADNDGISSPNT